MPEAQETTEPEESGLTPIGPSGPVTVQVGPQGHVTITVNPPLVMGDVALESMTPKAFGLFGGGDRPEETGPGPFEQVFSSFKQALETLGTKIIEFTNDVTTLNVRTYVSERIEEVEPDAKAGFTFAHLRAMTAIDFDGDTDVVVPVDAGQIDEALWQIHLQTVEQAQAHRAAMLKTVGDVVTGFLPVIK